MTAAILNLGNLFSNMLPFDTNTVELLDTAIAWATQLAQATTRQSAYQTAYQATQLNAPAAIEQATAIEQDREWDALLKALAIAGFEQWLAEGAASLSVSHMSLAAGPLGQTVSLMVGNYRLCILAMGGLGDDHVELFLDNSADSLDGAIAHLYVIVEVQEEVNQVSILSGLRRDQLLQSVGIKRLQQARTNAEPLQVPISHFDVEPEQILLYLNCLEPVAVTSNETVEEDILEIAAETTMQTNVVSTAVGEGKIATAENIVDTAAWLRNQLDKALEQLRWVLLPPISVAMRPVRDAVDTVLEKLASQGIRLPEAARGVGGPISIGACICQMYAWVWSVETADEPEWTLLLLLGPQVGEILPEGIQLRVSDHTEVLALEVLAQASSEAYLYTQVQGAQQEQFKVSVILPDGMEITLPVFGFESGV
ncbi:MAG: DUF1822 family protein [Cyanobacteria bacterium P01_D01_bin.1]